MKVLPVFIVLSFIGIAVFGAFAMAEDTENNHNGCIASTAKGASCPMENGFSSFAFHINAFKSFSTAILNGSLASLMLLFMAFALALVFRLILKTFSETHQNIKIFKNHFFGFQSAVVHWISIHENSPNFY